jgi:hypothetical protein
MSNKKQNEDIKVENGQGVETTTNEEAPKVGTRDIAESLIEVKALINIKYDKKVVKAGQTFEIKESDVEEVVGKGCVEVLSKAGE